MVAADTSQAPEELKCSAFSAVILSLILPGLGHVYVGRKAHAATLIVLYLLLGLIVTLGLRGVLPYFWIITGAMFALLVLYLFAVIDSALTARRIKSIVRQPYHRWYVYVVLFVIALGGDWLWDRAVAVFVPAPGYYQIPSASMMPTLRPGETLLADTLHYRSHAPQRGDVAVFTLPKQSDVRHIMRIVAVGGDRIALTNGHAVVNGTPVNEPYVDVGDATLPRNTMAEVTVPKDAVFVLGDSRSNSADSREGSVGPIPVNDLDGRVTEIVVSEDLSRVGKWIGTP